MTSLEERRRGLSASELEDFARLTGAFESAWKAAGADHPDPSAFLPDPPPGPLSGLVLVQNLMVDLEYRSAAGPLPDAGAWVDRFPSLREDRDGLVEVLAWGSVLDGAAADGRSSGFDLSRLADSFPGVVDAVATRRPLLAREIDGRLPDDFLPDGYTLIRHLPRGGMSRVSLVWNRSERREEVLKVSDPRRGDPAEATRRFLAEIAIAGTLTGQVVPVYRSGMIGPDTPYYTMPYLRGGNLQERIDAGGLAPGRGVRIVREVCRAVAALHNHRTGGRATPIIHRDLKPANILFNEPDEDEPRVADLGMAKLLDDLAPADGPMTQPGDCFGTPHYMAPEQARGEGPAGAAADVHALGAILYRLAVGRPPYFATTAEEVRARTRDGDLDPPAPVAGLDNPADLAAVIAKAMARVPAHRYPDASKLADDLDRWLDGQPVEARPPSALSRARATARRYPLATALAAASILILIGGATTSTVLYLRAAAQNRRADRNALRRAEVLGELAERVEGPLARAGFATQRTDILRTIADDLGQVVAENEGIGSVELGMTSLRQSNALLALGRPGDALAATGLAATAFDSAPDSYEARAGRAAAHLQSGRLLAALGRPGPGRAETEAAVAGLASLLDARPDDADVRFRLARALVNLGSFQASTDLAGCITSLGQALDQVAILRRAADGPDYLDWEARTRSNLGVFLAGANRAAEAIAIQARAVELADQLVAIRPEELGALECLASCRNNLGDAHGAAGRDAEAEADFRAALAVYRQLAARAPGPTEFRWGVAWTLTNLAEILTRLNRPAEALVALDEAGPILDRLRKNIGADPMFLANVALHAKLAGQLRPAPDPAR